MSYPRHPPLGTLLLSMLMGLAWASAAKPQELTHLGPIVFETQSAYSTIRVRKKGSVHTLIFVRDSGREVGETQMDLKHPERLLIPYTRSMFVSYLFQPDPQRVLIVGLGGGAMVHFLRHHDPTVMIDAVEIDPTVVALADRFFSTQADTNTTIHTQDAFDFFTTPKHQYDVIFMDAFLKPTSQTDTTGVPTRLKTQEFLRSLEPHLTPNGVVVFNLNHHNALRNDVQTVRSAFQQTHVFRVPKSRNLIVVARLKNTPLSRSTLRQRGRSMDLRFEAGFSFQTLARMLTPATSTLRP